MVVIHTWHWANRWEIAAPVDDYVSHKYVWSNMVGYVSHLQEQKWTDLALGSLAPDAALIDQLNITAI